MEFKRWSPTEPTTPQERMLLKRHRKTRKLFAFLRLHRHELFDDAFQSELESMYRDSGAGKAALPPAVLAMATLLQGYLGLSDVDTVEATLTDLRWQMVLDCLGATKPAFSQKTLYDFRQRLVRHDMDRRLLERTIELAKQTGAFDWKKIPKSLDIAIDSSPLEGAGRVEDTLNLLSRAARRVLETAAGLLERSAESVARSAGASLLVSSSTKSGLDIDWSDEAAKQQALHSLCQQIEALEAWVQEKLPEELDRPPLLDDLAVLEQIKSQDLEPDPSGGGPRLRDGVAPDRRISVEDGEMRHGRKSSSKRIDGYKRHVARALDAPLIVACAVTPANQPEAQALPRLHGDIQRQQLGLASVHVDRAYLASPLIDQLEQQGSEIVCKPWMSKNGPLFAKGDFVIDLSTMSITCPAGGSEFIELGKTVKFDAEVCDDCQLRERCTTASHGSGRSVRIADNEARQQRLQRQLQTRSGRAKLRKRVAVEHALAHVSARQGNRARYKGVRKNEFDLRRAATIQNLEAIQRSIWGQAA